MTSEGLRSKVRASILLAGFAVVLGIAVFGLWQAHLAERRLLVTDPDIVPADTRLMQKAVAGGAAVYAASCAGCHGAGGNGDAQRGVPSLTDADWLFGVGRPSQIERIVTYGVRARRPKTWNLAAMPGYAKASPSPAMELDPLSPADIRDLVAFTRDLGGAAEDSDAVARGAAIYSERGACYDCHGADGAGDPAIGAPNLTDRIWLYGDGSTQSISNIIAAGAEGVCPAWAERLSSTEIREVSLYVYALSRPREGPIK